MRPGFLPHDFLTVGQRGGAPAVPVAYIPVVPSILLAIAAGGVLLAIVIKVWWSKRAKASYTVSKSPTSIRVNMEDLTTLVMESITPPRGRQPRYFPPSEMGGEAPKDKKPTLPTVIKELIHAIDTPIQLRKLGKRKEFIKLWTAAGFVRGTPEYAARAMGIPWKGPSWYEKVSEIRSGDLSIKEVAKIVKKRKEMLRAAEAQ